MFLERIQFRSVKISPLRSKMVNFCVTRTVKASMFKFLDLFCIFGRCSFLELIESSVDTLYELFARTLQVLSE